MSSADVLSSFQEFQQTTNNALNPALNDVAMAKAAYNTATIQLYNEVLKIADAEALEARQAALDECNPKLAAISKASQDVTTRAAADRATIVTAFQTQQTQWNQKELDYQRQIGVLRQSHNDELARIRADDQTQRNTLFTSIQKQLEDRNTADRAQLQQLQQTRMTSEGSIRTECQTSMLAVQTERQTILKNAQTELQTRAATFAQDSQRIQADALKARSDSETSIRNTYQSQARDLQTQLAQCQATQG